MSSIPLPFDQLDYQVIACLNEDARMSAAEMAKRIGANQRTIRKRINKLCNLGAIRLKGLVDPKVFGYGISVDIFLSIKEGMEDKILTELNQMAPISYLATGQSSNELSIEARFRDFEELDAFFKKDLAAIEGLIVTRYALVPRIIRNIDSWMPPKDVFNK